MTHFLEKERFLAVINDTPLVSIDLIVTNENGQILLGQRCNRPAQGYWFVPGGRIQKNEILDHAFERISLNELGVVLSRKQASLLGVYEHIYSDNFANVEGVGTHYVVIAYKIAAKSQTLLLPQEQHSSYVWMNEIDLANNQQVHPNTKAYVL